MISIPRKTLPPERIAEIQCTEDIWKQRWVVLIPRYAVHTDEFIKQRGIPYSSSMSPETRIEWNKEMVRARMSINRQIALYDKGIPIAYPDRIKAAEVYLKIQQHVTNWKILISGSLNRRAKAPPMEDFDLMLEFAENLEQYLDHYYYTLDTANYKPFQRQSMNRFVSNEGYSYRPDSKYNQLREGLIGFQSNRVERVDDRRAVVIEKDQSLYQPHVEFDENDALEMAANLRK